MIRNDFVILYVFFVCMVGHLIKKYIVFNLPKCKTSERHLLSLEKKADGLYKFQFEAAYYASSEH